MIVQAVTDVYYQHEGLGYVAQQDSSRVVHDSQSLGGKKWNMVGMDRNGNLVDGEQPVLVVSLKVVDIVLDQPPRIRVAIMQEIGRHWSQILEQVLLCLCVCPYSRVCFYSSCVLHAGTRDRYRRQVY